MNILFVGIGGFFGAILRYIVAIMSLKHLPSGFPYATLIVNVTGSFCLGLVAAAVVRNTVPERAVLFLGMGFLGAFTTFSTFSLDVLYLFKNQQYAICALNIMINPVLAISAAAAGMKLY